MNFVSVNGPCGKNALKLVSFRLNFSQRVVKLLSRINSGMSTSAGHTCSPRQVQSASTGAELTDILSVSPEALV